MEGRPWMLPLALAAVCLMALTVLGGTVFGPILIFVAMILLVITAGVAYAGRKGKYDLGNLQRVHEQEELRAIELNEPQAYDSVICPNCGQQYSTDFPTCPTCARPGRKS
jgi:hypothetical protein